MTNPINPEEPKDDEPEGPVTALEYWRRIEIPNQDTSRYWIMDIAFGDDEAYVGTMKYTDMPHGDIPELYTYSGSGDLQAADMPVEMDVLYALGYDQSNNLTIGGCSQNNNIFVIGANTVDVTTGDICRSQAVESNFIAIEDVGFFYCDTSTCSQPKGSPQNLFPTLTATSSMSITQTLKVSAFIADKNFGLTDCKGLVSSLSGYKMGCSISPIQLPTSCSNCIPQIVTVARTDGTSVYVGIGGSVYELNLFEINPTFNLFFDETDFEINSMTTEDQIIYVGGVKSGSGMVYRVSQDGTSTPMDSLPKMGNVRLVSVGQVGSGKFLFVTVDTDPNPSNINDALYEHRLMTTAETKP